MPVERSVSAMNDDRQGNASLTGSDAACETKLPAASDAAYEPDADRHPSGPMPTRPVSEAENGSMVQDMSDLKRLGEEMERVKTGAQLRKEGLVSDPAQE